MLYQLPVLCHGAQAKLSMIFFDEVGKEVHKTIATPLYQGFINQDLKIVCLYGTIKSWTILKFLILKTWLCKTAGQLP